MTLPDSDNVSQYGGLLNDYAPVTDPTTDRPSGGATAPTTGANIAFANVAMMTAMCPRAWVRFTTAASTGALVLVSHQSLWGNTVAVAPTLVRATTGLYTVTWPASVQDQANVSHTLALRAGWANNASLTSGVPSVSLAANVATVILMVSGSAADAVGTNIDVFAF